MFKKVISHILREESFGVREEELYLGVVMRREAEQRSTSFGGVQHPLSTPSKSTI